MTKTRHLFEFGPFSLDLADNQLFREGKAVPLPPKVFETLLVLVQNGGRTVTKDELMERLWPDRFVEESNLSQNIFQLRKVLGNPDQQYIETIPKRGYRFAVDVQEIRVGENSDLLIQRHSATNLIIEEHVDNGDLRIDDSTRSRNNHAPITLSEDIKTRRTALIVSLTTVIVIGVGICVWHASAVRPKLEAKSIAVLPFQPLDSASNDEQLRLGIADALISRLSNLREFAVRPTTAILKFDGVPQNVMTTGQELKVDLVVEGTIQREGDRLKVRVKLVRVNDGKKVWDEQFDEQFTDILAIEDSISQQLTAKILGTLSEGTRVQLARSQTENTEAYQSYIRGRYFWNKRAEEDYKKALKHYRDAIELDPSYALAYAGLADCFLFLAFEESESQASEENYRRARAAAMRALELDERLAEAHTTLAAILSVHDGDWIAAERAYKQAIESNPNYPTAHHWYGWDLLMANKPEEALSEMMKAQELDPLSININTALGQMYYYLRRYDQALDQFKKTLELDADKVILRVFLAMAFEQKGMLREAVTQYQKVLERDRSDIVALGGNAYAHALMGKRKAARTMLAELKRSTSLRPILNYQIAAIHTALGDRVEALSSLGRIPRSGLKDVSVPLRFDPRLDQLRADVRFKPYLSSGL